MSDQESPISLYTSADSPEQLAAPVDVLPAIRVWGDVLLELTAEADHPDLTPAISTRRTSLVAHFTREPPVPLPVATSQLGRIAFTARPASCAIARADLAAPLYAPSTWKSLGAQLSEAGFDGELLQEEFVTLSAPATPMHVQRGRAAVESTDPRLLDTLLELVGPFAHAYLDSWDRFPDTPLEVGIPWEVLVPPDALISAGTGTT